MKSLHRPDVVHECWELLTILVVGALGYLPGLGSFSTTLDERIYFDVARQMATAGHWLVPRYTGSADIVAGTVFLEKPPLVFWLQAISVEALGATAFAVRLPSVAASLACAVVVHRIATRWYGRRAGFAAALAFLATPAIYWYGNGGRTATTDVFLTLFGTLFVWWLWRARTDSRYLVYAGVAGGLAAMSKQAAAGVFLVVALPLLAGFARDRVADLAKGAAAGLAVVLPWNLFASLSHPETYVRQMVAEQAVGRLGTDHAPLHGELVTMVGPFNPFYALQFPSYLGPLVYLTAVGAVLAVRADLADADADSASGGDAFGRRPGLVLCWWLAAPVALFTVATSSTWIHYVQGSVVPAAVLAGYAVARSTEFAEDLLRSRTSLGGVPYPLYAGCVVLVAAAAFVRYSPHQNAFV
ncbi:ArnT family glycosyltransferase [Halosimplex pelagicum]|uniref:Glycosyltransferase family 39 protein n=1 Tax=Halosimplex pelagicum TaxID=869886 RepID=A0A7D5P9Z2_9EURY|nr:glycosyltransferase family 39 protein [Halosimplex pelagicum]QLH81122.1 glycosyltransferase family 39 protein [Halosimplex pelagicum]